jgi:hypothetical protein
MPPSKESSDPKQRRPSDFSARPFALSNPEIPASLSLSLSELQRQIASGATQPPPTRQTSSTRRLGHGEDYRCWVIGILEQASTLVEPSDDEELPASLSTQ